MTPLDCSPAGSSVHGISQARILEWVANSFSRGSSWPRDRTCISCISCISRWVLYLWATTEAPKKRLVRVFLQKNYLLAARQMEIRSQPRLGFYLLCSHQVIKPKTQGRSKSGPEKIALVNVISSDSILSHQGGKNVFTNAQMCGERKRKPFKLIAV